MNVVSTFASTTGSPPVYASAVAPTHWSVSGANGVPFSARLTSVFLTTR